MKQLILTIFLVVLVYSISFGQAKITNSVSPKTTLAGTKPDTTFNFSNGKSIDLCGYVNPGTPKTYSEFVLTVCGQDTIIDFWGAVKTCKIKVKNDTLFVENLYILPVGQSFKSKEIVWITDQIYFEGSKTARKKIINKAIPLYDKVKIESVLTEYKTSIPDVNERRMDILTKLFVATISGNNEARLSFNDFQTKFGTLDGEYSEQYIELKEMLLQWDNKK